MNKRELMKYIEKNSDCDLFALALVENILNYAEGMEEAQQYNFLSAMLPIEDRILKQVHY